jgi:hypothetical protein
MRGTPGFRIPGVLLDLAEPAARRAFDPIHPVCTENRIRVETLLPQISLLSHVKDMVVLAHV